MFIVFSFFWFGTEHSLGSNCTPLTNGNFDLLWLGLFSLRQNNLQDTVLISRFHFIAVDAGGAGKAAREGTEETLVFVAFLAFLLLLPLSRNGENAVV